MRLLLPIISGLTAALVVYLLSKTVREGPKQRGSRNWVAYGPSYKILSVAFFPLSAFVAYAALQAAPDQKSLALVIAASFGAGTLYLAYEFFFVRLSYDDHFIYHWTPLRRQRQIPWSAVKDLHYSSLTQTFSLKTDGLGDISVSPFADGSLALVERARIQLEADRRKA